MVADIEFKFLALMGSLFDFTLLSPAIGLAPKSYGLILISFSFESSAMEILIGNVFYLSSLGCCALVV